MDTFKYKLIIAYDGTNYEGWQFQKTGTGVQEKLESALAKLFPSHPRVHSSSRTDTGVHAIGMVAHFELKTPAFKMAPAKLRLAVNAWLPKDIRVMSVSLVPKDFHARFDATGKQYRFFIWNAPAMNPLIRHSAWHVPRPLDLDAMREAAPVLVGKHDFRSFSANQGYLKASTIRELTRCDIRKNAHLITFVIEGGGFIYKMCRGIVGTLVQVGQGKFLTADVLQMLSRKDRRVAGMTAPAHGLVLWKVFYRKKTESHRAGRKHRLANMVLAPPPISKNIHAGRPV